MSAVIFNNVAKQFESSDSGTGLQRYAVQALTFEVGAGEIVAVVGKTGCGKSTMFNLLIGLIAPTSGRVEVLGHNPFGEFDRLRGKIGVVFQNDRLLPWRNALDNVAYGLELSKVPHDERYEAARGWLTQLGLSGHEQEYPHALSGGMRQRVSIARAFATHPQILLCDEPFSALDELTGATLRREFQTLVRETTQTSLFITHSIREAIELGQRILVFRAPGHVALEIDVQQALAEHGESRLKEIILEAMGDKPAAPDIHPS